MGKTQRQTTQMSPTWGIGKPLCCIHTVIQHEHQFRWLSKASIKEPISKRLILYKHHFITLSK